jgi:hypothetical protein
MCDFIKFHDKVLRYYLSTACATGPNPVVLSQVARPPDHGESVGKTVRACEGKRVY